MTTAPASHLHPGYRYHARELTVVDVSEPAPGVKHIVFADPAGGTLTGYEPGSHLIVEAGDHRNAYSLVGDGFAPREYAISVLRRGEGGGSDWIHEHVRPGMTWTVEGPRSMFAPRHEQRHALLVAGGIGITPVLSHARAALRWGTSAEILYAHRPGHGAHLDDVRALAGVDGIAVFEACSAEQMRAVMRERFLAQPLGTHAYACGPAGLLDAYLAIGVESGWPESRLHLERFEAPELDPGVDFDITLASTGERLRVPSGVSLLQRLLDHGLDVPNLCRQGVCGECRIPVGGGEIEHRDLVLTDDEKAAGDHLLCCVSRGRDLEVNL